MDTAKLKSFLDELQAHHELEDSEEDVQLPEDFPDPEKLIAEGADPQFAMYVTAQAQFMLLATMLEHSGIADEYRAAVEAGIEEYTPGAPPLSPITDSYFYSWLLCDLTFGPDHDNIGRMVLQIMEAADTPDELRGMWRELVDSRMGIYETLDFEDDLLLVRELVTNRELLVDAPTQYMGHKSDLRFVRLGPPALPDADYYSELTTPYLLQGSSADDWTAYLERVMPDRTLAADGEESDRIEDRLAAVFKEDLGAMPWHDFVFQGYYNFETNAIFLRGMPDDPSSLPNETTRAANDWRRKNRDLVRRAQALGIAVLPPSSNESTDIAIALTDAQRQAAADLMPNRDDTFKPTSKGKKNITLPPEDWQHLSSRIAVELMIETGRGRTRLRNLRAAVDGALLAAAPAAKTPPDVMTDTIYRLRIDLQGIKPPIWRRIEVPDCSLAELHDLIQAAMGWTDSYLHQLEIKGIRYSIPNEFDDDFGVRDSTNVWLSDVVRRPKANLSYKYDFGDNWTHAIVVEAIEPAEPSITYPRCVAGKRACLPEDCGGIWGYAELLEIVADPNHRGYEERMEWCRSIDPEHFRAEECTSQMRARFTSASHTGPATPRDRNAVFDVHEDLIEDELDEDRFQAYSQHLQNKFRESPEFHSLPDGPYGMVDCLLHFGAGYLGVTPATISVPHLQEILFDIIPR